MRTKLQQIEDERNTFMGVFNRFGEKNGYKSILRTVLLKDIKNKDGEIVTNHLWFNLTKGFNKLDMKQGDIIQFNARVKEYEKGYKGYREDVYKPLEINYRLSHPTKLSKITQ